VAEGGVIAMKTFLNNRSLTVAAVLLAGCGSSVQPEQPKEEAPPVVTTPEQPKASRTIVNRPLLGTSPHNLLLDIAFREAGWGHFTSFFDGASSQYNASSRTFSLSPLSVTAPVGVFKDPAATDEKSKGIMSIASFLGGKGPFVARVWVTRSNVAGSPLSLDEDPTTFRAAITTGGFPEGKAYDLARKNEKTIGDRTWFLFEGQIDGDLPSTAFFNLKFGRKGGAFMVQAPEVIAKNLLPPGDTAMAMKASITPRAVTFEESAAVAAYLRQPHQLGLPAPRFDD
jgi:hypothetical protein